MTSERPFFVVGCPRSGTTMLRLMLDAHPRIAIPSESHFVAALATPRLRLERRPLQALELALAHPEVGEWDVDRAFLRERVLAAQPQTLADVVRALFAAYAESQGKPRWGDKTPGYVRRLPTLARLFPDALFVHMIRDGREVAASLAEMPWGPPSAPTGARWWDWYVGAGLRDGRALGSDRYLELRYDQLVREPERVLRELCDFLGEAFHGSMLRPDLRAPERLEVRPWTESARRPPTPGLRSGWAVRLTRRERIAVEWSCSPLLHLLGYEARPRRLRGRVYAAAFRARDARRTPFRLYARTLLRPAHRAW